MYHRLLAFFSIVLVSASPVIAQTAACIDGLANGYACNAVDLMAFMDITEMGGTSTTEANDIWGWTDPDTGKEYALVGLETGTAFVDVSDPEQPVYLGTLPTHTSSSIWRDIKVYNNHAFIVSEASAHGMQVFDLTELRSVSNPPATFSNSAHYNGFGSAHNIVINEASGFAYSVGSNMCAGGLEMIDISNPLNPTDAGCFSSDGYTHDAQCVIYNGPDTQHQGKEICVNSNEDTITIVDVTTKSNPIQLSRQGYPTSAYVHQGWFDEEQRYFYQNDELDESGTNTRTIIWDLTDLDDPFIASEYFGETTAIDHNLYVRGNLLYETNYTAGLRIIDVTDRENPQEVAFFDTYPSNNAATFNGTWSNYPYFASGNIIVSSIEAGLFIVRPVLGNPTASFTSSCTLLSCNFTDTSIDSDGTVVSWDWSFGDGNVSTVQNPSHAFAANGTYTVVLSVTDNEGNTGSFSQMLTVNDGTSAGSMHVVSITTTTLRGNGGGNVEATVIIEDESGNRVDAATVSGTFSGDLSGTDTAVTNASGEAPLVSDFFSSRPTDLGICINTVTHGTLTYDPSQNSDPSFACDTGGNLPPAAAFTVSTAILTATFTDTSTDSDGTVASWSWDFGDGNTSTLQNPAHTYAASGTYTVVLTVTDDMGATGSTSQSVSVSDGSGGSTMHIESITTATIRNGSSRFAESTFLVVDNAGAPVSSATVSASFNGDLTGTDTGITDGSGIVVLQSDNFSGRPSDLGVCASSVTHATLTYDASQNTEPDFDCGTAAPSKSSDTRDVLNTSGIPTEFALGQNYPNPFNPTTLIDFAMPATAHVSIKVYNTLGQEIETLVDGTRTAGYHTVSFDSKDMSAGVYLYVMETGATVITKRMTLLK